MSTLTGKEIERRFTYHRPEGQKIEQHNDVRQRFASFAAYLNAVAPDCDETEIAFRKLEEAANWFHAAIARPPRVLVCRWDGLPDEHPVHHGAGSFPLGDGDPSHTIAHHQFTP